MTGMETVPVVIRFQVCIFDILNTAEPNTRTHSYPL